MPLCAAASLQPRFPASDAALPRRRGEARQERVRRSEQLAETDRNGKLARPRRAARQLGVERKNKLTRAADGKRRRHRREARRCRNSTRRTFVDARASSAAARSTATAPAFGKRKAALYATCFVNYNKPDTGMAARAVLAQNGVETEVVYPGCCGMPHLEQGDLAARGRAMRAKVSRGTACPDRRGLRHRRADRRPAG